MNNKRLQIVVGLILAALAFAATTLINLSTQVTGTLPIVNGGTGTTSTLTGLMRGNSSAMTAAELTGDVTTSGSNVTTLETGNAGNLNSGTLLAARMPALTGDCTTASGAVSVTCTQINGANFTVNTSGLPTKVDGITTAGQGVAIVQCITSQKSETAGDATLLSCTPASVAGTYRIQFLMSVSAATSCTLSWTATWTDSNSHAQAPTNLSLFVSGTAAPALTFSAAANAAYYGNAVVDVDNSGTAIVLKLVKGTCTSFAAKVTASVERII